MFVPEYLDDLIAADHTPRAWAHYLRRVWRRSRGNMQARGDAARSVLTHSVWLFVILFAGAAALSLTLGASLGTRFLVTGSTWLIVATVWMLLHLGLLRDTSGRFCTRFNAANALTLLRLVLIPSIYVFVVSGERTLAGITFFASATTDVLDGFVARRFHQVTRLGVVLDPLVDMAHNGVTLFALAAARLVPDWVFALVAARYGLLLFGSAFIYFKRGRLRIRPTVFGKLTGVLITLMVTALMLLNVLTARETALRLGELLSIGLGFVFLATTIQGLVIGWHNFRYAHKEEPAVVAGPWHEWEARR